MTTCSQAVQQRGVVTLELLIVGVFCVTLVWFGVEGARFANTFSEVDKSMRAAARYAATTGSYALTTAQNIVVYGRPLAQGEAATEIIPGLSAATVGICFSSPTAVCSATPTPTSKRVTVTVSNLKFTPATPLSSLNTEITLRSISVSLPTLP